MANRMQLFLLTQRVLHERNYDKAQAFVIAAKNTKQARKMAAKECGDEGNDYWLDHKQSKISGIATSSKYQSPRIVIRSYISG